MNYRSLQTISRWFIVYIFCVHVYELTLLLHIMFSVKHLELLLLLRLRIGA